MFQFENKTNIIKTSSNGGEKEMAINVEKLKELVIDKGLSYEELAEKTGMSKTQISRIVNGKVDKLRPTTVSKLCKGLGISCKELSVKEVPVNE